MERAWVGVVLLCLAGCSTGGDDAWPEELALQRTDIALFGAGEFRGASGRDAAVLPPRGSGADCRAGSGADCRAGSGADCRTGSEGYSGAFPPSALDIEADESADQLPREEEIAPAPSPICTPECQGRQCGPDGCGGTCGECASNVLCVGGACASAPPPVPGDLAVDEILADPAAVPDKQGEWFEVLCLSASPVDLWGLTIRSGLKESFAVDHSLVAEPGQLLTFARLAGMTQNGGVAPDFLYSGLQLSNESDSLALEFAGELLDEVFYAPPEMKVKPGASLSLDPWLADPELNDYAQAWCPATSKMSGGDKGTPGAVNDLCP